MRSSILGTAFAFLLLSTAQAASPSLSAVRPVGGQRGTELDVTFSGARLGDALEVVFYQPGITAVSIKKVNDNAVTARLKIAQDCALGLHDLRLRTATGISELRTFSVGALKEVNEVEPNNDFAAPQAIPMNSVVNGVAENEDVDYFVVQAKKGERISAEVEGHRLGIFEFDPYVAILNAKRFELGASDDAALVLRDGFTSVIAPEDGKYIIQVREKARIRAMARASTGSTWGISPERRPSCPPAASSVRSWSCGGSATRPGRPRRRRRSRPRPLAITA